MQWCKTCGLDRDRCDCEEVPPKSEIEVLLERKEELEATHEKVVKRLRELIK